LIIPAKPSRLPYIDNIRIFCTALVVLQHAAVTYSGMGSWYYTERSALDLPSMLIFGVFQSHTQAFFMSLFFLLAGYFIPASLERKGPKDFLYDRLLRLGVPLLVYVFALHPLIVKILHPEMNFGAYYSKGLLSLGFVSWTGPLWFVEALLIFTIACVPFARWLKPAPEAPDTKLPAGKMWLLVVLITALAFSIRLVYPVGTSVANLQFCYFAAYVVAFVVGVLAGKHSWIAAISYGSAKRWLIASWCLGLPLWLGSTVAGGAAEGRTDFNGGMNVAALG
jgi:peptidoglycan/LPS O-acetylase OafA/YrhL